MGEGRKSFCCVTWEQKRRRVLPAYSTLSSFFQWEKAKRGKKIYGRQFLSETAACRLTFSVRYAIIAVIRREKSLILLKKGERSVKRKIFVRHLLALFTVFSVLPLLLSGNEISGGNGNRISGSGSHSVVSCALFRFADSFCTEQFLPFHTEKITQYRTARRLNHPRHMVCCAARRSVFFFAVSILCTASFSANRTLYYSRRFIIKYIHDQDGLKGKSFDL